MNTGAFAFLGHSIGALMAIKVAKRARAELGVEPVFVIMLERGAGRGLGRGRGESGGEGEGNRPFQSLDDAARVSGRCSEWRSH